MSQINCPHCGETVELADAADIVVPPGRQLFESSTTAESARTVSVTPSSPICSSCGNTIDIAIEVDPRTATTIDARPKPDRRSIAHFELLEELGVGGFGTVYRARDSRLDRIVAVKIPRDERLNPNDAELFLREARAAAQLKHPGIVGVHEVGRVDGSVCIVSDFIEGVTMTEWRTGRAISIREAAELCAKVADALHHAHEAGVVHRDLKPPNIMLDAAGAPYVMDFGLARRESEDVTITAAGQVMGTPAYMSPEQARGDAHTADRRCDVYSLGVILYELITGERPFRGSVRMLLLQIQNDEPPSPRKLNGAVPKDLETITLKCLEKSPAGRYATARELADEFQRYLSDRPIHARPISRPTRVYRWCKRNRLATALVGSVMLLLLTLAIAVPWIVAERAERRQQAVLAQAEKDRDLRERRARIQERLAAADAALRQELPRNAVDHYSEVIGLASDEPEFESEYKTSLQRREQLDRYVQFLTAERDIAMRVYDIKSTRFRDPEDPDRGLLGPKKKAGARRSEERRKIVQTLSLLGVSKIHPELVPFDGLPLTKSQKESLRRKVTGLQWRLLTTDFSMKRRDDRKSSEDGLSRLDRIVAVEGHSHAELMLRMWYLDRLGRKNEADRARDQMAATKLVSTHDYFWRGYIHLRLGRAVRAKNYFLRVIKDAPDHYDAHFALFECYRDLKDKDGQLRELAVCLALAPRDAYLFLIRGLTRFTYADGKSLPLRMAFQDFDAAIQRDKKMATAWYYRGRMLLTESRWADAEKDISTALQLDPKFTGGHYWRAICRAKLRRIASAVVDAEQALRLEPQGATTHFYAARAYAIAAGQVKATDPKTFQRYADRSIELLRKAITLGYRRLNRIAPGSDFDPVRDHPGFPKVPAVKKN